MINESSSASVYTDFQGLAELRVAAARQTPEAMRETARQFEALFVQSMLKAMRDASQGEGLFESDQTDFYRDIHDHQLALEIVKGRGLGIADMLVRSMGGPPEVEDQPLRQDLQRTTVPQHPAPAAPELTMPLVNLAGVARPVIDLAATAGQALVNAPPALQAQASGPVTGKADWYPADPEAFIREVLPVARKGAERLGVQPAVLVAQAALETGWGQRMIRHPDGRNSFNLFGIKADGRWQGERATVTTLEYDQGVARRERAAFRAYGSLEESVNDYVEFLNSHPRYQQAIESSSNSVAFLHGLKEAGYATDPHYVEKIRSIMDGKSFNQGMQPLLVAEQEADRTTADLW
ncbi:MAG: flagellar assembly peptidoglycan hydrolase FlgJ [Gammaproteobacteria bacterium]